MSAKPWALLALLAGLVAPRPGAAQTRLKGALGGALVGTQVVWLAESGFGVGARWAYLVGGGVGLVGGGAGGYFLSRDDAERPPVFLLGAGVTLIVPTVLAVVSALQQAPPDRRRLDRTIAQLGERPNSKGQPSTGATPRVVWLPPSVAVGPLFDAQEQARGARRGGTQVRVSLLRGRF